MPNCSYPANSAGMDLAAQKKIDSFMENNPNCVYKQISESISYYWELDGASLWMVDYILAKLEERKNAL